MSSVIDSLFSKSAIDKVQQLEECKKCRILNAFWPYMRLSQKTFNEEDYAGFFRYIGRTLQGLHQHEGNFAAQSFDSLFGIIQTLRDNPSLTRTEMVCEVKKSYLNTPDTAIYRSIQLAIQLWLCLNVHSYSTAIGALNPRTSRAKWNPDERLDQMIAAQFPGDSRRTNIVAKYQIDDSFTLANLKKICRLNIRWTNNLKDHLRLEGRKGRRVLSVYQQRVVLVNHYNDPRSIIPNTILMEAIRTLDLLLPFSDPGTENLLEKSDMTTCTPLEGRHAYDLEDFTYWKSNLIQLLDLLNGPPESLLQALRDTRNLSQWATMWIAVFGIFVLTLVFGIMATVYSIRQYRVAVDSYEVSIKSYELARAVACQQRTGPLPEFCD
ncbi:hypothetical protein BJX63DRAFT_437458 [Aspergillus granulosus]|uniref:Uncharacterized protein n=1 Tax=Aspergillus granulosus TaxID=176169 RepID=A0ABR4GUY7_9EURO